MINLLTKDTNAMIELILTTNLTVDHTSMEGLLQTSTPDMAIMESLAEASTNASKSMIDLHVVTVLVDGPLHPAYSMDDNLAIVKEIELLTEDLFKAFDELEQDQRKRCEEMFPEFSIQPCDVLRAVASLKMDKTSLTQQLELANNCIADLQYQVLAFESKNTLSSKCHYDPVEEEYIAIKQEIDAQILSF
ncbi:hypothetical protein AC1031_021349 [Aphanomyces cochlioides]|nr:hypothetical protein AC1031_021349 [Aphanomyces cochlioides]